MENTSCRNKTPLDKFKYEREKSVFNYFGWSGALHNESDPKPYFPTSIFLGRVGQT